MMEKSAPTQETRSIEIFIKPEQRRSYFNLPFTMPENVDSFTLAYHYDRSSTSDSEGGFTDSRRVNTIDLGLIAPDGSQAGASGSDKSEISIGPTSATPGYNAVPLEAGEWQIMVGAYKIASEGVRVTYDLTFTFKQPRWLRGDFHTHTIASDGVLTAGELGIHALRHGLDFLAITDHNQFVSAAQLPQIPGLTLIQGVEWTHYEGHANFLGVDRPYNEPFPTSTPAETLSRFTSARQRGALIVINHPFDEGSGFNFDFHTLPFDCLEIWNGPMRESNLQAVGMWRSLQAAGQKIPIVGGSDYHRDNLFQILGGPTTCVYSSSASAADILSALREGHAYLVYAPAGPSLEFKAGDAMMGDSVAWSPGVEMQIALDGLQPGDRVNLVTGNGSQGLLVAPSAGSFLSTAFMTTPGFAYIEVQRVFLPGIPPLIALISNPIYFD